MAIVHIATKAISRKAGQSAVASAAYRAGVILKDERYDKSHDYSKKSGVMSADIILPTALKAKGLTVSREEIWNKAEHVEGRKDSRVAREWLVNLPYELSEEKRKALAHEFTQTLADKYNIIADCAIHSPSKKEVARGADPRNYHAHILATTREAKMGADGQLFFDKQLKIPFEWSNKKRKAKRLQSSIDEIKEIRQLWVDMANSALAELDVTPLDARSFKDQGLDRLPTVKMGVDATNMERKGINTDKGNENRAIHVINQRKEFTKQSKERAADERHTVEYIEWATERVEWATNRHQQIVKRTNDSRQRVEWATKKCEFIPRRTRTSEFGTRRVIRNIDGSKSDIERVAGTIRELNRRITSNKWRVDLAEQLIERGESSIKYCYGQSDRTANRVGETTRWIESAEQRTTDITEQERRTNSLITKSTRRTTPTPIQPNPFDDNARRARAARIIEQERRDAEQQRQQDSDIRRNSHTDERTANAAERLKIGMAMALLARHHENSALQYWETIEDDPDKFDERQLNLLDSFAQKIGADGKATDFINDSRRVSKQFTAELIEQNMEIFKLLRNPADEREQYNNNSKTLINAPQDDLTPLTRVNTNDASQASNIANERASVSPKRYRP
jgi:hypothetical protein